MIDGLAAFIVGEGNWLPLAMSAALIGGQLIQHLTPTSALHAAAWIAARIVRAERSGSTGSKQAMVPPETLERSTPALAQT